MKKLKKYLVTILVLSMLAENSSVSVFGMPKDEIYQQSISANTELINDEDVVESIEADVVEFDGALTGDVETEKYVPGFIYEDQSDLIEIMHENEPEVNTFDFGEELPVKYTTPGEYLPPLRNQKSTGTCWAHATLAAAEINMLKKGIVSSDVNFSEMELSYFAYNNIKESLKEI